MNKTKVCKKCGEEKDITLFVKNKKCKDGYTGQCKECRKGYNKRYREKNKEYYQEYHKKYNQEHKEELLEKKKQYRKENKEFYQEYHKQYYKEHKEELSEKKKQYYENNKEELSEKKKQHYENNKEYYQKRQRQYHKENPHILFNAQNRRRSKEEQQGKGIDGKQWFEMMKFFDFKCAYSGESLTKNKRTIDHILCLDNGGLNEIWNLVPMYKSYNCSKRNKNLLEWYKKQDFYSEENINRIIEWQIYAYEKWATEDDEDLILIIDII